MDDEQAEQLRRLREPSAGHGSHAAPRRDREYGDDDFPVETVLLFRRLGHETRSAVKVTDDRWTVTGRWWKRSWKGLTRVIGPGYDIHISD